MPEKPVAIFATCLVDSLYPDIGMGMVRVLDRLGIPHTLPPAQTCCGQPAFNAGFRDDARAVGRAFVRAFRDCEAIVAPSGSCVAYVRSHLPHLLDGTPEHGEALGLAERTWEFSEYVVDVLHKPDLGARLESPLRVALHNGCHAMRFGGIERQPRILLENVRGLTLADFERSEECCGLGGLFSVKMPQISTAMMEDKIAALLASGVDVVLTGDAGCLMHLNGGLARAGHSLRVRHYAELLGEAL
ncbi:MAG: (Fe-S)-binding protein [Fimbriimonadia bacterium]|jgi:L-lactate dehydrogenase complex protein LldE